MTTAIVLLTRDLHVHDNPTLQAQRYDADRTYVRRWVPEVDSGDYPAPIVDHTEAVRAFRAARAR